MPLRRFEFFKKILVKNFKFRDLLIRFNVQS